ncbi:MAG: hypothetical protein ACXADY_01325 [Candidatus Hodarchaeales archaeon]
MPQSKCEELVREATEASKHSLQISAGFFVDAAKCYDRLGDRKKAGQYLMLAGDFFLDLNNEEKAASCYGKAIMRHLMIDDIDTAEILLEKGKEYGFSSSTHQYRIALDALERQRTAKIEEEKADKLAKDVEDLPDIDILPIEEDREEELIPLDPVLLIPDEDILPKQREYLIPQLEKEGSSTLGSFAVLAAVSKATRQKIAQDIHTNAVVKNKFGESQFIEPQFTLNPLRPSEGSSKVIAEKVITTEELVKSTDPVEPKIKDESPALNDFKNEDTLDLDYMATSEIINEFEDELVDVEIVNTIPFNFQVVNIKTDFELEEKKRTSDGLVFTWKKDRIEPGEKISVEFVLRKRVERSIILRKENKVSVINSFHSIEQNMEANLDFVNTSGMVFHEILIEDIIPPELVVNQSDTPKKIKPVTIPTHDSTLFRWIFSTLTPGDNFSVDYQFREKPLTRHYKDEIEFDVGIVKIEKISQPVVDSTQCEYLWFYSLENPISDDITITDRIPLDFSLLLVDPAHLNPSIENEKTHKRLTWILSSDEVFTTIILRIGGSESFTPLAPSIEFARGKKIQLVERSTSSEKKLVDIRRLKNNSLKESA